MKKLFLLASLVLLFTTSAIAAWAAPPKGPRVVVSIKPLHSLVAGVMAGVGEPQLLIKGGGSPHGYALRPSEARMLAAAQLVVWVGPRLEAFLEKPLATLGSAARQLQLSKELASELLTIRAGGNWADHAEQHAAGEPDPHLWLDPRLAQQIVTKIAAALAGIDPPHQLQYQENAARLIARLAQLQAKLQAKLAPVRHVPYVVFHDAYQYFEAAFGLNAVGSVTLAPERLPGARRIREIREEITSLRARCVFSEPQFEPRLVATVIEGTGARTGILDPLGAALPAGQQCYFRLLTALADNLVAGLRE